MDLSGPIRDSDAGGVRGDLDLFPGGLLGDPAYLTQSGQLYNRVNALAVGQGLQLWATFRAEKSKTRRHLTEFWMIEPEVAYMDLDGFARARRELLSHIVQSVLKNRASELAVIGRDRAKLERSVRRFRGCGTTRPRRC